MVKYGNIKYFIAISRIKQQININLNQSSNCFLHIRNTKKR